MMNLFSLSPYCRALLVLAATPFLSSATAQQLPPPASSPPASSPPASSPPASSPPAPRVRSKGKPQAKPVTKPQQVEPDFRILPAPALEPGAVVEPKIGEPIPDEAPAVIELDDNAVIIVPPSTPMIPIPPVRVPRPKATPRKAAPRLVKPKTYVLRVGGVDITKLSDAAAVRKLRQMHEVKLQARVLLFDGNTEYAATLKALGVSFPYAKLVRFARQAASRHENITVPLRYEVDEQRASEMMRVLAKKLNRNAQSATLDVNASREVVLRGGDGLELAVAGSAQRLRSVIEGATVVIPVPRVELVVRRIPSGRKGADQSTLEQFRYLLAEFSTPYDAGLRGRTNNLRMAARLVDGSIVEAGQVFSANRAIGPRNAEAGWREAKMFVSGQVVNGVGAGICQCSTTIYNAALLAGLPIVERHPHSMRVTYAPASRDAAIYWGSKDLRFRNNTSGPIYVQTWLESGRFYARLYGTQPRQSPVRVESRVISRRNGTRSEAFRVRQTSDGPIRESLSRDFYKPRPDLNN